MNDTYIVDTLADNSNAATNIANQLLPEKSKKQYEKVYQDFIKWKMQIAMMSQNLKIITVFVIMTMTVTNALRLKRQYEDRLNLNPVNGKERTIPCKTRDNRDGFCMFEGECLDDHIAPLGGVIDESDLRLGDCVGQMIWCCVKGDFFGRPLNVSNTNEVLKSNCKTSDNFKGICAPEDECDRSVLPGGNIEDDELRIGNCPGLERCCPLAGHKGTSSRTSTGKSDGCSLARNDECPWCVALYRSGGNPNTKTASGLYCGGVVIDKSIILTSATCVLAARNQDVWARLPNSATPLRNYTVGTAKKHPDYNSGTKESDVALMVLEEDVVWGDNSARGACLGLRTQMTGQCTSVGFDENDKMVLTPLTVSSGSCSTRGVVQDASCGRAKPEVTCVVSHGSPVLCPSDLGGLIPTGVARQTCRNSTAMLGSLSTASDWINSQLRLKGLSPQNYTIGAV